MNFNVLCFASHTRLTQTHFSHWLSCSISICICMLIPYHRQLTSSQNTAEFTWNPNHIFKNDTNIFSFDKKCLI